MSDKKQRKSAKKSYNSKQSDSGQEAQKLIDLQKQLEKKQEEATSYLEGWKRERAKFDNFQKDLEKQKELARKNIFEEVGKHLLPVVDDFEEARSAVDQETASQPWAHGMLQASRKLEAALEQLGFQQVPADPGEVFDPEVHEAVAGEGEVISEVQRPGYIVEGKLIRPAMVTLTTADN